MLDIRANQSPCEMCTEELQKVSGSILTQQIGACVCAGNVRVHDMLV